MYRLDRAAARDILVSELGYEPHLADFYLDHYPVLHEDLGEVTQSWLEDRSLSDVEVEGITLQQVMEAHNCHFLEAVRSLSYLLARPLNAEEKEALMDFLRSPLIRR